MCTVEWGQTYQQAIINRYYDRGIQGAMGAESRRFLRESKMEESEKKKVKFTMRSEEWEVCAKRRQINIPGNGQSLHKDQQVREHGQLFRMATFSSAKQGTARNEAAQFFNLLSGDVPPSLAQSFFSFPNKSGAIKNLCI